MTYFYRWGPKDAENLSWSELLGWEQQGHRINKMRAEADV